jgi:hypothetical protein
LFFCVTDTASNYRFGMDLLCVRYVLIGEGCYLNLDLSELPICAELYSTCLFVYFISAVAKYAIIYLSSLV